MIHWALGQNTPLAVTAMGGKFAIADSREIPDTLEVVWTYPGNTLVTFSQFNATAPPAGMRGAMIEFRGTKGTLFLQSNGYEVVPDNLKTSAFPVLTPLDRQLERAYRAGVKPAIAPRTKTDKSDTTAEHARDFLDCMRSRNRC